MVTHTLSPTTIRQVVDVAHDLYRRLGSGWSPTIYRDGLTFLLRDAGVATCSGREIGAAPCLARDLVAAGGLVIRVAGVGRPRHTLAECLAATGLASGLLLHFDEAGVEVQAVTPPPTSGPSPTPCMSHAAVITV